MNALNVRPAVFWIASPLQWRLAPGLIAPGLALALLGVSAGVIAVLSTAARWHDGPVPETVFRLAAGLAVSGMVAAAAMSLPHGGAKRLAGCPGWMAVLGCVGCAALAAAIARLAFGGFANSADEYGFLFAAETLLRGRVTNPIPADPGLVQQVYLIARDGRWASQYLPGWPAILAAFGGVGLPAWLAAPACALGMLGLLARAAWRVTARAEITAGIVLACAASPFVVLNAATYFSHCASALFSIGAVLAQLAAERRRDDRQDGRRQDWRCLALAGGCLGALLLCRIDSLLVAGSGVFCAWAARPGRGRALFAYAAGAAPFVLAFALYNLAVTGNPLTPPTVWGGNLSIGAGGLTGVEPGVGHWRALVQTAWRVSDLADTTTLVIPALYAWALTRAARRHTLAFYDVIPLAALALFLVFPDYGGWQMGPRYWFDGFVVMHLTAAREIASSLGPWRTRLGAVLALLVPAQLAMLAPQVGFHARVMAERAAPFRLAAALPGPAAFVLVGNFPSGFDARFNRHNIHAAQDFMRNGPDLADPARRGRLLFVRADAPDALARACRLRPGVPGYGFSLGPADPQGRLTKLACPRG